MQPPATSTAILFASLLLFYGHAFAEEGEDDDFAEQDFLFFLEEAYTQEKGEWQFSLSLGYFDDLHEEETDETDVVVDTRTDLWVGLVGVEYGITDRLQIELELPYLRQEVEEDDETSKDSGLGDVEFALSYALIEEDITLPQLTAGLELAAPTGDEDDGLGTGAWGWGPFIAVSKQVKPKWYLHANLAYQVTNNAEEEGEEKDERELEYGVAAVYQPTDDIDLVLELVGAYEKEKGDEETEHTNAVQLVPGIKYELDNELQVGAAIAVGLTDDTFDIGGLMKIQYEF